MRSDRIQRPPDPVIVKEFWLHPESFTDRPVPRPPLHMHQRRGRGQPVGHQRLDHLPVRQTSNITHRT